MIHKGKDRLRGMIKDFRESLLFIFREVLQNIIGGFHPAGRATDTQPQAWNVFRSQLLQNGGQATLTARST